MMTSKMEKYEWIKVYIRFKPLQSEKFKSIDYTVNNDENGIPTMMNLNNSKYRSCNRENLSFKFDEILPSNTSQSIIFDKVASPLIDKFVQKGINGTIFSYGQTGSGKTYTICGLKQVKHRGIIHQTFGRIFDHVLDARPGEKYDIHLSFIEIYNDQIRDLTRSKTDSNVILFHTNIKRVKVKNESSAIDLFEKMKLKRKSSATNRNEHSSRSHFICTVHLTKYDHMLRVYDSEFNLVDLAGSERYADIITNKTTEFESRAVNKSLYHLRQVARKLADPNFKGKIPYRDCRLTWALENTLGGRCRVALIANVDSNDKYIEESVNTFKFATDIACIKKPMAISSNPIKRVTPFEIHRNDVGTMTNLHGGDDGCSGRRTAEIVFIEKRVINTSKRVRSLETSCDKQCENVDTMTEIDLPRKDEQQRAEILLSFTTRMTERLMEFEESINDISVAASDEIAFLARSAESSRAVKGVLENDKLAIESNTVAERSCDTTNLRKRSIFGNFYSNTIVLNVAFNSPV